MSQLTIKQQQIYSYILSFSEINGYPPSVREIAEAVQLKSPSTVHFHLKRLRLAGLISQADGKTRTISIHKKATVCSCHNQIPILGSVAAGTPILTEACIEGYLTFDTGGCSGEHFALRVQGESMIKAGIFPNDLVVVHQHSNVCNGNIVVALFKDKSTIKTYQNIDGHIWLLPENDAYHPINGDGCSILGKVVAVVRKYT